MAGGRVRIMEDLATTRHRVLVPMNGYSSPASFPGHVNMTAGDWARVEAPAPAPRWGPAHVGQQWEGDDGQGLRDRGSRAVGSSSQTPQGEQVGKR